LNFEVNSLIYDHDIAQQLRNAFYDDLKETNKIEPKDWANRTKFSQLGEKLSRLLSPLM
jgi:cardiolipin synthase